MPPERRELEDLSSGQAVAVYNPSSKSWTTAEVKDKLDDMLLKPPMVQSYDATVHL